MKSIMERVVIIINKVVITDNYPEFICHECNKKFTNCVVYLYNGNLYCRACYHKIIRTERKEKAKEATKYLKQASINILEVEVAEVTDDREHNKFYEMEIDKFIIEINKIKYKVIAYDDEVILREI